MLVFVDQQMVLYEMGTQPRIVFQIKGKIKKVKRRNSNLIQKKVLITLDNKYQIFDLEDTTFELINITRKPFHYFLTAENEFRLIWVRGDEISVSNWKEGHLQVEDVWYTSIEDFKITRIFSSGVVVYNKKRNEIFRFKTDQGGGK
jgi:predicted nucleic-acid-binding Zn-ribbon protein